MFDCRCHVPEQHSSLSSLAATAVLAAPCPSSSCTQRAQRREHNSRQATAPGLLHQVIPDQAQQRVRL